MEVSATSYYFYDPTGNLLEFAVYRLPNGDTVEIFGPGNRAHEYFDTGPVAGFVVDDVEKARSDMEEAGVSFIGPVHTADDGGSWSHFAAPAETSTKSPERPRKVGTTHPDHPESRIEGENHV